MGHDQKVSAFKMFEDTLGGGRVFGPEKVWIIFDHHAPADTVDAAMQIKAMRHYVKKYGLKTFLILAKVVSAMLPFQNEAWSSRAIWLREETPIPALTAPKGLLQPGLAVPILPMPWHLESYGCKFLQHLK